MVTAIILNWNTNKVSEKSANLLLDDVDRVIMVDNGSDPLPVLPYGVELVENGENLGSSVARNIGLDMIDEGHVMMLDGDVLYVQDSVTLLERGLNAWPEAGCVGFDGSIRTRGVGDDSVDLGQDVENLIVSKPETQRIAWTQYGLFRDKVARKYRFDETGYFGMPGYGFEDNDYYLQMAEDGWHSYSILGMTYHHNDGSSKPQLSDTFYAQRSAQLGDKWGAKV